MPGRGRTTLLDVAEEVLRASAQPLHVDEIYERADRQGLLQPHWRSPREAISAALRADVRDRPEESRFRRVEPNTFALRSQEHPLAGSKLLPNEDYPSDALPDTARQDTASRQARRATMEDLSRVVHELAGKASRLLAASAAVGEENTKVVFVEPMLQALGWDTHDLDEVRREFRRNPQDNPVDYALFISGKPRLFVEVKDLGRDLGNRRWRTQAVNYANTAGVEWCVLTDGNFWQVYRSNAPGELEKKLFLETCLHSSEDTPAPSEPTYLLSLLSRESLAQNGIEAVWQALHVDRSCSEALRELLTTRDASLVRLIRKHTGLTSREVQAFLARVQLSIAPPPPPEPSPRPRRAPDSRSRRTRTRRGVLTPQPAYCRPILQALVELGGSAPKSVVIDKVGELMAAVLTSADRTPLPSGELRWRNRAAWARLVLVRQGLLSSSSPTGMWEITEAGRRWLHSGEAVPASVPGAKRAT